MRNTTVLLLLFSSLLCSAQESDSVKFYRLDFVVKEVDGGKIVNARNYSMSISNEKDSTSSSRSGDKVPYKTGVDNFSYTDFGVNIDCRAAREMSPDRLALSVVADISGSGTSEKVPSAPLIRNTKWSSHVIVALRKPTVVFSADDAGSKMQMQLELTATPIK